MEKYLKPTFCIDSDHPKVKQLAEEICDSSSSIVDKCISLFYAVRDGWRYYPYNISFKEVDFKASVIAQRDEGHCIDKAVLLIALCRACAIPARLGLASVCNHIATGRFEALLGTNILVPHGYVEVYLKDHWLKLTPAFNKTLCEKLGVSPLEFDGHSDALFQEFSQQGASFMEYLEDFGTFEEVPTEYIMTLMKQYYPRLFNGEIDTKTFLRNAD